MTIVYEQGRDIERTIPPIVADFDITVDDGAVLVDGEHPVAVAVERDAEVGQVRPPVGVEEDVAGRHVAVQDAGPVHVTERVGDLGDS